MVEGPVGFWSYVHADNDAVDGAILELRQLIMNAYSILTGEDLTLFVDTDITWGEQWEKRISASIAGTTFFIPIITPRFFKSKACRQEVIDFTTKATEASGLKELFLPILYADVPFLSKEADDPVVRLVANTQYVPWHQLRLLDSRSSDHRTAVHKLAVEIERISRDVADKPDTVPAALGGARFPDGGDDADSDEGGLGTLDRIAAAEEVMPLFNATIGEMAACLNEIGEIATASQPEIEEAARSQKMSTPMAVIKKVAANLDRPAQQFLDLSTKYSEQAIDLNAGIDVLIHLKSYSDMDPDEQSGYRFLANSIRAMRDAGLDAVQSATATSDSMQELASFSRDMRRPATKMKRAVERMEDVHGLYDEWVKGFEESGVWANPLGNEKPNSPAPESD
ncbi:toll/interleukin-1 receptor domain-containing protein [Mycobacterium sp. NBC_00419]|uniref:TIR domain-containing protein n=1 Tax=Mycobacterium sp. NBC_00419 TaxID=2975989 RepID=UPI002E1BB806